MGESLHWFFLVIGDRDALGWILSEQRMAFAPSRHHVIDKLRNADRLVLYTTRDCFHNPTRDRGRVIGTATVASPVQELKEAVTFGERRFSTGCALHIDRLVPVEKGRELTALIPKLRTFPPSWKTHIRRTLVPLDEHDFMELEQSIADDDKGREVALPTYLNKISLGGRRISPSSQKIER